MLSECVFASSHPYLFVLLVCDHGLMSGLLSSQHHRYIVLLEKSWELTHKGRVASLKDYLAQQEAAFKCVSIMLETAGDRGRSQKKKTNRKRHGFRENQWEIRRDLYWF